MENQIIMKPMGYLSQDVIAAFAYDSKFETWFHVCFQIESGVMLVYLINKKDKQHLKKVEDFILKQSQQLETKVEMELMQS